MFKRKLSLKSILAFGLAIAMIISTALAVPVFADNEIVFLTPKEDDEIIFLTPKEDETVFLMLEDNEITGTIDKETMAEIILELEKYDMEREMRKALDIAKTHIEIDEEIYVNFSYEAYDSRGITNWQFTWNSADYNKYISISVANELIISYSIYDYSVGSSDFAFAKLTKAEAEEKAFAFLKKILGSDADKLKVYSNSLYYNLNSYDISFAEYKDGYRNHSVAAPTVGVDKLTGEIISYWYYKYSSGEEKNYVYQDAEKIISVKDAAKAYVEKIGLDLVYLHYFDYSTKKSNIFPVYKPKSNNKYISAVTGEVIDTSVLDSVYSREQSARAAGMDMGGMYYNDGQVESLGSTASPSYSQAELTELEKIRDYITRDKAIEIFLEALGLSKDELKDYSQNVSLNKNYVNQNQYLWDISFYPDNMDRRSSKFYGYYYASIDARDGSIISYSRSSYYTPLRYDEPETEEYKYTYDEAKKIVLDEIKKLSPISLEEFEFVENDNISSEKESAYSFTWYRKANGILFESNGISISFDNLTGEISYYRSNWYEDVEFPELTGIIPKAKAFDKMIEYSDYTPVFVETGYDEEKNIYTLSLVYMLGSTWVTIDPYTGDYLNYMGKPDTTQQEPDYDDVKGHWSEKVVTTLTDNGIYVWGGKFEPDKAITTREFLDYLQFYSNIDYRYYISRDKLYSYIYKPGGNSEISDDKANATVTKQEAAKIICELLGFDRLLKKPEYLIYPFGDDEADEEYKGYITLCYMLDIIQGTKSGNYSALDTLTRAEAAQMLYNLLTK